MLKEVLEIIKEIRFFDKKEISKRLNIEESIVDSAFLSLLKKGYLEETEIDSPPKICLTYPYKKRETQMEIGKVYKITEKGIRFMGR
jgi:predicted transcriptional regulator